MNICVVVDNEFSNDIRVYNECLILSNAGHSVFVLCLNFGGKQKYEIINENLTVSRIAIDKKVKNLMFSLFNTIDIYSSWWSTRIDAFIKKKNIDVLHLHDLYLAKAGYKVKMRNAIKMVLDLHENYPFAVQGYRWMNKFPSKYLIRPWIWKKKEKSFLRYPDKIIVLSEYFKSQLLDKYSFLKKDQITVYPNVPNTLELLSYQIDKNIIDKRNSFILFYFGGVSKRRGIFVAIEALKLLIDKIPQIKLLIIGPVDKAEQKKFNLEISNKTIRKHIIYFPWKDISLLPSFISISDICLSPIEKNPQHESGIANKVYQYMLFKRPLLVSNCKPQASLVEKAKCGLVHEWDSAEDFTEKVQSLYNNKDKSYTMGINGNKEILTHHNQTTAGMNLLKTYIFYK